MMSMDEFRTEMESYRRDAENQARALRDPYIVPERLHTLYKRFDANERRMADQVFCEWAVSDDENLRFLAMNMIEDLRIKLAVPALRELARRLVTSRAPGAPHQLEMANRIIGVLMA
jgi:hypothetical protein